MEKVSLVAVGYSLLGVISSILIGLLVSWLKKSLAKIEEATKNFNNIRSEIIRAHEDIKIEQSKVTQEQSKLVTRVDIKLSEFEHKSRTEVTNAVNKLRVERESQSQKVTSKFDKVRERHDDIVEKVNGMVNTFDSKIKNAEDRFKNQVITLPEFHSTISSIKEEFVVKMESLHASIESSSGCSDVDAESILALSKRFVTVSKRVIEYGSKIKEFENTLKESVVESGIRFTNIDEIMTENAQKISAIDNKLRCAKSCKPLVEFDTKLTKKVNTFEESNNKKHEVTKKILEQTVNETKKMNNDIKNEVKELVSNSKNSIEKKINDINKKVDTAKKQGAIKFRRKI